MHDSSTCCVYQTIRPQTPFGFSVSITYHGPSGILLLRALNNSYVHTQDGYGKARVKETIHGERKRNDSSFVPSHIYICVCVCACVYVRKRIHLRCASSVNH